MFRTTEEWVRAYSKRGALWLHSGKALDPHVVLRSGLHSSGFFNSRPVIKDEQLLDEAAWDLGLKLKEAEFSFRDVLRVVGPQTGATKLSEFLARVATNYGVAPVNWASPAKHEEHGVKSMIWLPDEPTVYEDDTVLLCEDVLTTGGSVELAEAAVLRRKAKTVPYIAVLVNRSGLTHVSNKRIVALIDRPMPSWSPEECPLCKGGSVAIENPKDNWDQLVHPA